MAPAFQARHLQHLGHMLGHVARLLEDALRQRAALLGAQALAALGEAGRGAGHDGERRAQVVRDRREQRAADALGLGFDLERRLRLRPGARTLSTSREMTSADGQHDRERQQVLRVVDREGALRRHEQEVERRDAKDRRRRSPGRARSAARR